MRKATRFARIVIAVTVAGIVLLAGTVLQACHSTKGGGKTTTGTSGERGTKDLPPPVVCDPVHPGPPPAPEPK